MSQRLNRFTAGLLTIVLVITFLIAIAALVLLFVRAPRGEARALPDRSVAYALTAPGTTIRSPPDGEPGRREAVRRLSPPRRAAS